MHIKGPHLISVLTPRHKSMPHIEAHHTLVSVPKPSVGRLLLYMARACEAELQTCRNLKSYDDIYRQLYFMSHVYSTIHYAFVHRIVVEVLPCFA